MFKLHDMVTWKFIHRGYPKNRLGEIVYIVPVMESYLLHEKVLMKQEKFASKCSGGIPRDYISYIVAVQEFQRNGLPRRSRHLYWPKVSLLEKVEDVSLFNN